MSFFSNKSKSKLRTAAVKQTRPSVSVVSKQPLLTAAAPKKPMAVVTTTETRSTSVVLKPEAGAEEEDKDKDKSDASGDEAEDDDGANAEHFTEVMGRRYNKSSPKHPQVPVSDSVIAAASSTTTASATLDPAAWRALRSEVMSMTKAVTQVLTQGQMRLVMDQVRKTKDEDTKLLVEQVRRVKDEDKHEWLEKNFQKIQSLTNERDDFSRQLAAAKNQLSAEALQRQRVMEEANEAKRTAAYFKDEMTLSRQKHQSANEQREAQERLVRETERKAADAAAQHAAAEKKADEKLKEALSELKAFEAKLALEKTKTDKYFKVYGFDRLPPEMEHKSNDILHFIDTELQKLVGQEGVKKQIRTFYFNLMIRNAKNTVRKANEKKKALAEGKDQKTPTISAQGAAAGAVAGAPAEVWYPAAFCGHMLLTGKPGCGKTTIALLIAKILQKLGLVNTNYVYKHANNLMGQYVGYTKKHVHEAVEAAKGGVLVIEEAYSFLNNKDTFGQEAIDTILEHMNKPNAAPTCVFIFIGYEDKMKQFLAMNDGLQRRIAHKFTFHPYTSREIGEMVIRQLADAGEVFVADPEMSKKELPDYAHDTVQKALDSIVPQAVESENAALANKLIEEAGTARAERLALTGNDTLIHDPELAFRFTKLDFVNAVHTINIRYKK